MKNVIVQRCNRTSQIRLVLSDLNLPGGLVGSERQPDEVIELTPLTEAPGPWHNLALWSATSEFLDGVCAAFDLESKQAASPAPDPNQTALPIAGATSEGSPS